MLCYFGFTFYVEAFYLCCVLIIFILAVSYSFISLYVFISACRKILKIVDTLARSTLKDTLARCDTSARSDSLARRDT